VGSSWDSSLASSIEEKQESSPSGFKGEGGGSSEGQGEGQGLLNESGTSSAPAESTLVESLTRLELNSLQLKIYLDSIDQRISRMEPRLEKVAPLVLSTPEGRAREEPAPRFSAAIASANAEFDSAGESLPQRDELSVGNEPGGAAIASSAATGRVAVRAPTGADSWQFKVEHILSGRRQSLPIFVGVAVLLFAASLFWWLGRYSALVTLPENASMERGANAAGAGGSTGVAPASRVAASPVAASQGTAPLVGGAQGTTVGETHGASAGQASAPVGGRQEESVASGYGGQAAAEKSAAEKSAALTKKSAQEPLRAQTPLRTQPQLRTPLQASPPAAAPMLAKESAEAADSSDDVSDGEDVSSVPGANRPVDVSSGVMAANLLSAPKPEYPKLATLTRTEGSVVMQAVISKEGSVEEVHVIKGHRLLRGAAKNAVRNWRYRPYKVGGVPVEVATTVSVDFSLHH
jgi:TonB family protein